MLMGVEISKRLGFRDMVLQLILFESSSGGGWGNGQVVMVGR
jgi:hypothetical protein